jgi:hypothetical protein
MANSWYPSGRDRFATGDIDWTNASTPIRVVGVKVTGSDTYTFASSHTTINDVDVTARMGLASCSGRTTDGEGELDASDTRIVSCSASTTTSGTVEALIVYEVGGASTSSYLLFYIDDFTATTCTGRDINITWAAPGSNAVAKL